MNDKELADRLVELGIGVKEWEQTFTGRYITPAPSDALEPHWFVRDWRVAGALLQKCEETEWYWDSEEAVYYVTADIKGFAQDKSLPRAIIEACVEALEDSGDGKHGIDWSKVPETIQPSELKLWQENIDDD